MNTQTSILALLTLAGGPLCWTGCTEYNLEGKDKPEDDAPGDSADPDSAPPDTSSPGDDPDEECNGIDDDLDGEIDEGYPDSDGDGTADCEDEDCDLDLPEGDTVEVDDSCASGGDTVTDPWDVSTEWTWTGLASNSNINDVIITPVIGNLTDTDGDGDVDTNDTPNVVFAAFRDSSILTGVLVVVEGDTGTEVWTQSGVDAGGGIAVADVDGDGITDVLAFKSNGLGVAYSGDGTLLWTTSSSVRDGDYTYPQATVADLDADGAPEVIFDRTVVDGATGAIENTFSISSAIAYRMPAVGDIDLDGDQDVIIGNTVYDPSGTVLWSASLAGSYGHWSAILNADSDPEAEVAMIGGGRMALFEHDGTPIVNVSAGSSQPGAPCVADFDGDGTVEIGWASSGTFNMRELDGSNVWSAAVNDSSGLASCSGYDIDADGATEVLFADQDTIYIFDGSDGTVRWSSSAHASGTLWEYPSVADVDKDGAAELVVAHNDYYYSGARGVTVFGQTDNTWLESGSTWHTHDFAVDNIGADGSVPSTPPAYWQTYNVYRARPAVDHQEIDLEVEIVDLCAAGCLEDNLVRVSIQVSNAGTADAPSGVEVNLYADDGGTLTLLDTTTLSEEVPSGRSLDAYEVRLTLSQLGSNGLLAHVDEGGAIEECDDDDNIGLWEDPPC